MKTSPQSRPRTSATIMPGDQRLAPRATGEVQHTQSEHHVHRAREFGIGYGNSSGYGIDQHFIDGHVDPMFRCG